MTQPTKSNPDEIVPTRFSATILLPDGVETVEAFGALEDLTEACDQAVYRHWARESE